MKEGEKNRPPLDFIPKVRLFVCIEHSFSYKTGVFNQIIAESLSLSLAVVEAL
ncbi:hypothetical protein [Olivibacter domesticus]|uniref:Uncharacterized protein n=1 Tax=Olivibacter domesticus TaxID=407022 RepID=A0A1H7UE81_OLID1|nr:hypothetical protein [Olivibacter domesticus]SEL95370.1 hypothetical protein SAMN05661044_03855 [Olivibacter domesticus]